MKLPSYGLAAIIIVITFSVSAVWTYFDNHQEIGKAQPIGKYNDKKMDETIDNEISQNFNSDRLVSSP